MRGGLFRVRLLGVPSLCLRSGFAPKIGDKVHPKREETDLNNTYPFCRMNQTVCPTSMVVILVATIAEGDEGDFGRNADAGGKDGLAQALVDV